MDRDRTPLAEMNLNLLVALDALLSECNVTRAAERVGVTQPAMSHSLRRLRQLLDDPLLVPGQGGMIPTTRAEALRGSLRRALLDLEHAIKETPEFEPATAQRRFVLAVADFLASTRFPNLAALVARTAPAIDLDLAPCVSAADIDRLSTSDTDLAITAFVPDTPGLCREVLSTESFAVVVRGGHPAANEPLTVESFANLSHVLVSPGGDDVGLVDQALAELGLKRRIAVVTRHFLVAPTIVAQTDYVLTAPRTLCEAAAKTHDLVVLEPPLAVPDYDLEIVWHERVTDDAAHQWLRKVVHETMGVAA